MTRVGHITDNNAAIAAVLCCCAAACHQKLSSLKPVWVGIDLEPVFLIYISEVQK